MVAEICLLFVMLSVFVLFVLPLAMFRCVKWGVAGLFSGLMFADAFLNECEKGAKPSPPECAGEACKSGVIEEASRGPG